MKMLGNLWNRVRNRSGPRKRSIVLELGITSAVLVMLACFAAVHPGTFAGYLEVNTTMSSFSPDTAPVGSVSLSTVAAYYTPPPGVPEGGFIRGLQLERHQRAVHTAPGGSTWPGPIGELYCHICYAIIFGSNCDAEFYTGAWWILDGFRAVRCDSYGYENK